MFAEVTARETGRHLAGRALWLLGSTGLQGGLVAAVVAASLLVRPPPEAPLEKILPPALLRPPTPRPPPRPPSPAGQPRTTRAPPPPSALIQPQDVSPVASVAPGPPDPVAADAGPSDGEWVPGTQPTGAPGAGGEEEILHVLTGFRAPAMAARGCVQQAVRVPRELAGFVSGPVVVKFAVGRDGQPSRFSVLSNGVPERLGGAIWQAVQDCRWVAGADPAGQPVSIWVVMPLRFAAD